MVKEKEMCYLIAGFRVSFARRNQRIVQVEDYRRETNIATFKCFIDNITFIHYFSARAHKHTHHTRKNSVDLSWNAFHDNNKKLLAIRRKTRHEQNQQVPRR